VTAVDRRRFLVSSAALSGLLLGCGGGGGSSLPAGGGGDDSLPPPSGGDSPGDGRGDRDYGPLAAAGPELALPAGFTYRKFGVTGSVMSDGSPTPSRHDGMAAFALPNGNIRLVRNHEISATRTSGLVPVTGDPLKRYDPEGRGGTTSLEVEVTPGGDRRLVAAFASLGGTIMNCAGGPTPWGSWISCEESTLGERAGLGRPHGYCFEVPAAAGDQVHAEPLPAMGRFVHEAVAVDPGTGVVYLTEDRENAGFYRFVPDRPGSLAAGGRLQMLAVAGRPGYDAATGQRAGVPLPVAWVDIDEPDPADAEANPSAVFDQGRARGGARFIRGEGCWYGGGGVFFTCTTGGDAGLGQVWEYRPGAGGEGALRLVYESTDPGRLDGPDNVTLSPRGGVVICEDGGGDQYLRGLTREGRIFDFARNIVNGREFAGATFSPDGETLFVNIQGDAERPGMTFAIWGPWGRGAL
jgi:secreted PhoX family phosphatase